jgi:hypothetical protein
VFRVRELVLVEKRSTSCVRAHGRMHSWESCMHEKSLTGTAGVVLSRALFRPESENGVLVQQYKTRGRGAAHLHFNPVWFVVV